MDSSLEGKVQHWSLYLQQFSLEVLSLPGLENLIADWMSQSILDGEEANQVIDTISIPIFGCNPATTLFVVLKIPTAEEFIEGYSLMSLEELAESTEAENGLHSTLYCKKLFVPCNLHPDI